MHKLFNAAVIIFMVGSQRYPVALSASGPVSPTAGHCLWRPVPLPLGRVETGVKRKAPGFLSRASALGLMGEFSASLVPSIWQKRLVIKVDSTICLGVLTKNILSKGI